MRREGPKNCLIKLMEYLPSKKQLQDLIPPDVFERSNIKAGLLVLRDLAVVCGLGYLGSKIPPEAAYAPLWALYGFWQGAAATGLWVLAHECGHGALFNSSFLNDTTGFMLHSSLLVPYFSWQYSHAKHHAKTNHLLDGESHVPPTRRGFENTLGRVSKIVGDDAFAGLQIFGHLVLGWPLYLLRNETGARRAYDKGAWKKGAVIDHFRPGSYLFPPAWRFRVLLSSVGVTVALLLLYITGEIYGHARVNLLYWPAYLWVNAWLVGYTWLQHTHPEVPHYGEDSWTWMRGALGTVDRPYAECFGIFDTMHHHIGSTHVFHHLFSKAPCYSAQRGSEYLRGYLIDRGLYNYDNRGVLDSLYDTARRCHFVESTRGIQYFKKSEPLLTYAY